MPKGIPNKKPEVVEEVEAQQPIVMNDEQYRVWLEAKAADANADPQERLYAMREIGRLNAKG